MVRIPNRDAGIKFVKGARDVVVEQASRIFTINPKHLDRLDRRHDGVKSNGDSVAKQRVTNQLSHIAQALHFNPQSPTR